MSQSLRSLYIYVHTEHGICQYKIYKNISIFIFYYCIYKYGSVYVFCVDDVFHRNHLGRHERIDLRKTA
ncbi:hypothetical protein NY2A_B438R [Paramecium bursaria Chlorella virus NY2A]|uniref:Uncharacterized protein B438R n=1 Tax=Paramecium bursaria Chlorella virus NY2A TaxID=46021 RepID=A7IWW3_PBCVN|nr:hypothetical protein NY2A_B438R [Paramecium bursaria Chlorella virus NY2A]YP_001498466.1 hypothetical protein AR158_c385R [Paramecium bursaria Chlorella virus AR158]ABT14837.1 hypothetical protein NY2A_B438R [Paramecium bursaria Chlorella virus NY2A]ABU43930.1 hypothetical protein AR158_c385R [Paramecium bursaria Chlorella virus AR158]